jgi:glycosyltransferase involved in cell wall biosynthesis
MVQRKILITYTTGEEVRRPDFYDFFNMLDKPDGAVILPSHDKSPAHGRNELIKAAQENKCDYILFIDDDMAFGPDALIKLLEHDVDIVTGLYVGRGYPHQPVIFDLADDNGWTAPMYLIDKPHLKPIVAAGFGFLLVKTVIFDLLQKPYIRLGELNSEQWCDDIGFFNRVRQANIRSYCDMNVTLGHMGRVTVWPEYKDGQWYTKYDTGGTGAILTPQILPNLEYKFEENK